MTKDWDWKKLITTEDYHNIALSGFPGWDAKDLTFEIVKGQRKSSRDIAIEWDDISECRFYYRDFTNDALPFVREGATYRSGFVFQCESDYHKFKEYFAVLVVKMTPKERHAENFL